MSNWDAIEADVEWLATLMAARFKAYGDPDATADPIAPPPKLAEGSRGYAMVARAMALDPMHRMLLILALTPHVAPERLDLFMLANAATGRPFTEFGGAANRSHVGFLPTVQTARFLVASGDAAFGKAIAFATALTRCALVRKRVIVLERADWRDPPIRAQLRIPDRALARLLAPA